MYARTLVWLAVTISPWVVAANEVDVQSVNPRQSRSMQQYCGVAAVDLVARHLDLRPTGRAYEKLAHSPEVSIADLVETFRAADAGVEAYRVAPRAKGTLAWAGSLASHGVGQAILLVIPPDSSTGHYYVIDRASRKELALVDPTALHPFTIDPSQLWKDGAQIFLIVVTANHTSYWAWPVRPDYLTWFLVLPVVALCVTGFPLIRRARSSVARRMSRIVPLLLICAVCGCTTSDEVTFSPAVWDFGRCKQDEPISTTVTLRNNSATSAELEQIEISCSCVHTAFRPCVLAPGDSYSFDVSIIKPSLGEWTRFARIVIAGRPDSQPTITLKYEIVESLSLFPSTFLVPAVSQKEMGDGLWIAFELRGPVTQESLELGEPLRIVPIENHPPSLAYEIEACQRLVEGTSVRLRVSSPTFSGRFRDSFHLIAKPQKGAVKQFFVTVSGRVIPDT